MKNERLKNELLKKLENITYNYDLDEYYTNIYNAVIDYQNESQDWDFVSYFEDIVSYDMAEDIAKQEIETGGLLRLYYFLGDANLNNSIFKLNAYGNLEDINKEDLDDIKDQIIEKLKELED